MDRYIELTNISKSYYKRKLEVPVLDGLDLEIAQGEFVSLMGPSGSGKTTLLNLVGALDSPSSGQIRIADHRLDGMSDAERTSWRAYHCGFIFQMYHLLPVLTAAQNVELPLTLFNMGRRERKERVAFALEIVGLMDRSDHKPSQLSGGQEQRVAIARAIVTDPDLIIADEPTGDLDADSSADVLELLEKLNREIGKTIMMVTHDQKAAARASLQLILDKGRLITEDTPQAITPVDHLVFKSD